MNILWGLICRILNQGVLNPRIHYTAQWLVLIRDVLKEQ